MFASSGDSGAAGCDAPGQATAVHGAAVNALCTSAYSTCVGGTALAADVANPGAYWRSSNAPGTQASAVSYIGEAVWNESGTNLYATGGGASLYMAKPAWQLAAGVPSDGRRDVPDLSLTAAAGHDGYLIYTSDGQQGSTLAAIGGTSAAAPSMAGIAALVAQHQNGRTGNFNPVIYGLSERQVAGGAMVFHRITSGNNSVPGQAGFAASATDPTYNQATGLGSIDGALLVSHWNDDAVSGGLAPSSVVLPAAATVGAASLSLPAGTAWTATVGGGAAWLSVTPTSGTGSAPLTFAAAANPNAAARSGTITAAGQVLTVTQAAASGGAGSGQLYLSAATIKFGADPVGTPAVSQLLLGDSGNASLTLGALTLGGAGSAAFTDPGSCAAGMVLVPGAVCYLNVAFDPSALGSQSASLKINVAGAAAASVGLTGTGVPDPVDMDSDGPLPAWAYALLAVSLLAIGARRRAVGHTPG